MAQNISGETPVFLVVGKFRRAHGLRGEMIMEVITDFPERLRSGMLVFVGEQYIEHKIRTRRRYGDDLLIGLEGFQNPEQSAELRNQYVYVRSDMIPPLPEGEYYQHQLLGLRVIDEAEQELGRLEQIIETGANNVYLVRSENGAELLLPAIDQVILSVDLPKGEIRVHLLPGLLPE
jgi:16S rRNA processing protein RimM